MMESVSDDEAATAQKAQQRPGGAAAEPSTPSNGAGAAAAAAAPLKAQLAASAGRGPRFGASLRQLLLVLQQLPGDFWLLCAVTLFASYAYFATALQIVTFLTATVGETDATAGAMYGFYGLAASVWAAGVVPLSDVLGKSWFLVAMPLVGLAGRALMFVASSRGAGLGWPAWVVYAALLGPVAMGDGSALMLVNSAAADVVKPRGAARKVAYGLLYSFQNIGAMIAGVGLDFTTLGFHLFPGPAAALALDISQTVLLSAAAGLLLAAALAIALAVKRARRGAYRAVSLSPEAAAPDAGSDARGPAGRGARCAFATATVATGAFWRYFLLSVLCIGVKLVFRQFDMAFPTYMRRVFGPDAPVGTMYAIDPLVVIFLAPLLQVLTANFAPLRWIILGAWLTAAAPLLLIFSTPGALHLGGVVLFSVALAVGESLWSPRLNDYAADVAGPARLGVYMAASAPIMFLSKLPAGWLAGWLLARYCPSDPALGACDTLALWSVIATVTMVSSPLLLTLFYDVVYDPAVRRRWNEQHAVKRIARGKGGAPYAADDAADAETWSSGDENDSSSATTLRALSSSSHSGTGSRSSTSSRKSGAATDSGSGARSRRPRPAVTVQLDPASDRVAALVTNYASDSEA